jgi:predicted DNA-binding transcriptional regulator AlpA
MQSTPRPTGPDPAKAVSLAEELITLDELCEMARMGRDAYRNLRRQGRTPVAYKMGRRLYFRRSEAEAWVINERMMRIDPPRRLA